MLVLFLHFHQGGFELLPEFQLLVLVDSDFLKGPLKTVFVSLPDNFYFVVMSVLKLLQVLLEYHSILKYFLLEVENPVSFDQ